jgi:hypothetical protein
MLEDYAAQVGSMYDIPWEGFFFSAMKIGHASMTGLYDQVFIHNGKNQSTHLIVLCMSFNWEGI